MDSSSKLKCKRKRQNKRKCLLKGIAKLEQVQLADRISNLPDNLIALILSNLETDEAVRTSVLSSRWRYLWHGITRIQLHRGDTEHGKFASLVEHVLKKCTSKYFTAFTLFFRGRTDILRLNTWIDSALSFKIDELVLSENATVMEFPEPPFPHCNLKCTTLVRLSLNSCFDIEIPDSVVFFPLLKSLDLTIIFPDHESVVQRLLSCCPILEELSLDGYVACEGLNFTISITSLKSLRFMLQHETCCQCVDDCTFIIDAPNSEDLTIWDDTMARYKLKNLQSIRLVEINYGSVSGILFVPKHVDLLFELFKGIAASEILTIYTRTTDLLCSALCHSWPRFSYLTTLILNMSCMMGWCCLPKVLHSTPNLEVLILNMEWINDGDYRDCPWTPPEEVPICLLRHVNKIAIGWFKGHEDELSAVEYFLGNAPRLESMIIGYERYPTAEVLVEQFAKMLMFPRACTICEVEICERLRYRTVTSGLQREVVISGIRK